MKSLTTLALLTWAAGSSCYAQRIDFNMSGRQDKEVLEVGYTGWTFGRVQSDTMQVIAPNSGDTVTMIISAVAGLDGGTHIRTNWWKQGVTSGYKLIGDMAIVCDLDETNNVIDIKSGRSGIQLKVEGLPAGEHTLMAYHSNTDNIGENIAPLNVLVDGQTIAEGVKQRARGIKPSECPFSYIHFTATEGKPVTIQYISQPKSGTTYASTAVCLNAIVFDEANPITQAGDPYPANGDHHVDADEGTLTLSWKPSQLAAKHHVMIGTAAGQETEVAVLNLKDTTYTVSDLYSMNTYYWRIDEEDSEGTLHRSEEWTFRPRQLAFPGAEGYGRYAQGGRGGIVYHVTNLNHDHNPGSLLYGLTDIEGPRTIVFDVSGLIVMDFASFFADPYITLAPQTAPGKGICLKYSNLNIGSDNICRFLRARRGYGDTGNALGVTGSDHTIIDHTTAAWGTDETFSSRGAKNITFQYNMIAEALGIADHKNYSSGTNHGYAATIGGEVGTFSHNLLVNCYGRNWSMGGGLDGAGNPSGKLDMVNNVCYNWGRRTTDGGALWMQFVNNYYKMGPGSKISYLFSADNELGDTRVQFAYVSGNIRENTNGTLTSDKLGDTYRATGSEQDKTWVKEPFFPSYITLHTAKQAFKVVTSEAGATMPMRDDQHLRVVGETIDGSYTYKGSRSGIKGQIDHEDDCGGFEAFPEEQRAADFDTDQDGMPNWYERITGSNPEVADNNADPNHDGWTLLEDYLEFLSHPYQVVSGSQTITYDMAQDFRGFRKSPVYSYSTDSELFTLSANGSVLTIQTKGTQGVGKIRLKVTDGEGDSWEQTLSVAITNDASSIQNAREYDAEVIGREFFALDGTPVTRLESHQVYIMRVTYADGSQATMKIDCN